MTIEERAKAVTTCAQLVDFLKALHADFRSGGWENDNLDHFLESLAGWTADCDGYYVQFGEPASPWQVFAEALAAARIYE